MSVYRIFLLDKQKEIEVQADYMSRDDHGRWISLYQRVISQDSPVSHSISTADEVFFAPMDNISYIRKI